jgi:hypothetical protein
MVIMGVTATMPIAITDIIATTMTIIIPITAIPTLLVAMVMVMGMVTAMAALAMVMYRIMAWDSRSLAWDLPLARTITAITIDTKGNAHLS